MSYRGKISTILLAVLLSNCGLAYAIDTDKLDRLVIDRRYDQIISELASIHPKDAEAISWLRKYENAWHPPLLSQLSTRLFETGIKENQVQSVLIWAKARFSLGFDRQACARNTPEIAKWSERFGLEGAQQEVIFNVDPRALVVAGRRAINWAGSLAPIPLPVWLCGESNFKEPKAGYSDQMSYAIQFQKLLRDVESKLKPAP